jgi:CPW-WPC domain-containing protein
MGQRKGLFPFEIANILINNILQAKDFKKASQAIPSREQMLASVSELNARDASSLGVPSTGAGAGGCVKDYSSTCPTGYTLDNGACRSDGSVPAGCDNVFLNAYSLTDKQSFEHRCGVSWSCKGSFLEKAPASPLAIPVRLLTRRERDGAPEKGSFERKTQSPMIWLKLSHPRLQVARSALPFEEYAKMQEGYLAWRNAAN